LLHAVAGLRPEAAHMPRLLREAPRELLGRRLVEASGDLIEAARGAIEAAGGRRLLPGLRRDACGQR